MLFRAACIGAAVIAANLLRGTWLFIPTQLPTAGVSEFCGTTVAHPYQPEKTPPTVSKILPMVLRVGDRLTDETGEREVVGPTLHDGQRQELSRSRPA